MDHSLGVMLAQKDDEGKERALHYLRQITNEQRAKSLRHLKLYRQANKAGVCTKRELHTYIKREPCRVTR